MAKGAAWRQAQCCKREVYVNKPEPQHISKIPRHMRAASQKKESKASHEGRERSMLMKSAGIHVIHEECGIVLPLTRQ